MLNRYQKKLQDQRNKLIMDMLKKGYTGEKISQLLKSQGIILTRQRIHQIYKSMPED